LQNYNTHHAVELSDDASCLLTVGTTRLSFT